MVVHRVVLACLPLLAVLGRPALRVPEEKRPEPSAAEVFEKRILPIFKSPDPSSCSQCHLAGVDLKNYVRPTQEETFASLRDQGLIDLDHPEQSKILALIRMGERDKGKDSLVHQKTRQAEYEAFADWIKRSAADPKLRALPRLKPESLARPSRPEAVIRHARKDRLLESFTNTIWALRFRCMSCHTEGSAESKKLVREHGERVAWFKAGGPEATLDYLRGSKLIDLENPEKSLLLLKPLNEVKHGGGVKFARGDQGYKAFRTFIEDYARIVRDRYTDARSLPRPQGVARFGSDIWLKLANTPPAWGDRLLQVTIHAWDARKKEWEAEPVATSDRVVWGKGRLWQHNLTLLAQPGSERARAWSRGKPGLPAGRYLVKVHVDSQNRLARDWSATLGPDDLAGQAEFEARWAEGYGKMTVLDARRVQK